MTITEATNLGLSAVPAIMLLTGGFVVWKSSLSSNTIKLYKENQEALEARLGTLEKDHADNLTKISELEHEINIIKTLPLGTIMETLKSILETQNTLLQTQNQILGALKVKPTIINNTNKEGK